MAYPRELEELTYEVFVTMIKKNMRYKRKLVFAGRTKIMETKQDFNDSIILYVNRLKGHLNIANLKTKNKRHDYGR